MDQQIGRLPSMEAFLPLSRMDACADSAKQAFEAGEPYKHVVIDDFFDPALVDEVLEEFPKPGDIKWQKFDNAQEIKLSSSAESSFGPTTRLFLYHLNSATFLGFLSKVTGIPNLIADPCFSGGGLHQIPRGGKLGVHADFNKHPDFGLDRRLNLILYLNKEWREEYGGHLELWNKDMTECRKKVLPIFNRLMVFATTDFSFHGHPDPLQCPEGMTRKSLALYYFSNGRPDVERSEAHSTVFKARRPDEFKDTFRQKLRRVGSDCLPPIVTRQIKKYF